MYIDKQCSPKTRIDGHKLKEECPGSTKVILLRIGHRSYSC